jgi:hypothetical protein
VASGGTRSLTRMRQGILAAALAPALLAVGAAGCGSAGPAGPSAGTKANPLATLSADQIASKAGADLRTVAAVHVAGSVTDSGQQLGLSLTLVHGKGCEGSMSMQNKGSFLLIMIGTAVWLQPDEKFWKSIGGSDPAVLKILAGKYMRTSAKGGLGALGQLCDPSKLFGSSFENPTGIVKAKNATISGQPALEIKDAKGSDAAYVSVSARPQFLRITGTGSSSGQLDFTGYGTPVTLTAPPASQTLDGAKYGF